MNLYIRYSSQTTHALHTASLFYQKCRENNILVTNVQPFSNSIVQNGVYLFFISTTGAGSIPHMSRNAWQQILKKNYKIKQNVKFAIYSLGDRSYGQNFGMAGRRLRQRLKMLGGQQIVQIGLGDDQDPQGYLQVYRQGWADDVFGYINTICMKGKMEQNNLSLRKNQQNKIKIQQVNEISNRKGRRVCWIKCKSNVEVIEGDIIEIFPHNKKQDIEYLLQYFHMSGQQIVRFNNKQYKFIQILQQKANISSILGYQFFTSQNIKQIAATCQQQMYRDKIIQFSQKYRQYFDYISSYKRNIVEFLKDFKIKLPLDYFLKNIGQIIGRKYSICRIQAQYFYLLVKLYQYDITPIRSYKGLCSHDLAKSKGYFRNANVLKGDINPSLLEKNNIIITLGTGIAPFIWVFDSLKKRQIYSDQLFHKKICQNVNLKQQISCTRQGGLKIIRLIEQQINNIANILKSKDSRIFYCGPKQIQKYIVSVLCSIFDNTESQIMKKKILIYQNW